MSEEEFEMKPFPIFPEFAELLMKMGYEKYILAPEENISRGRIKDIMSEGFTHNLIQGKL